MHEQAWAGAAWKAFEAVEFVPELGNLTATAILGWYAWYTASRAIPHLVQAFREEMAAARAEYRAEHEGLRSDLAVERAQERADHREIVAALESLADKLRL